MNPSCHLQSDFVFSYFQFPITALREIRILQVLKHENVVNLIEICRTKGMSIGKSFKFTLNYIKFYNMITFPYW